MKSRHCIFLIISLTIIFMMAGCRSHKETVTERPPLNCPYEWLTATGDCEVMETTVNALIRTQCDSAIWLTASKIIELGRARLTKDSVIAYASIYNRYFAGTYEDVYRLTGVRTTFDELQKKIGEAYTEGKKEMSVKLQSKQFNQTVKIKINRIELSPRPLTFPVRIPANAQPLKF